MGGVFPREVVVVLELLNHHGRRVVVSRSVLLRRNSSNNNSNNSSSGEEEDSSCSIHNNDRHIRSSNIHIHIIHLIINQDIFILMLLTPLPLITSIIIIMTRINIHRTVEGEG